MLHVNVSTQLHVQNGMKSMVVDINFQQEFLQGACDSHAKF